MKPWKMIVRNPVYIKKTANSGSVMLKKDLAKRGIKTGKAAKARLDINSKVKIIFIVGTEIESIKPLKNPSSTTFSEDSCLKFLDSGRKKKTIAKFTKARAVAKYPAPEKP